MIIRQSSEPDDTLFLTDVGARATDWIIDHDGTAERIGFLAKDIQEVTITTEEAYDIALVADWLNDYCPLAGSEKAANLLRIVADWARR